MPTQLFSTRGTPLDKQRFTWRDLVQKPISKLDDDAFTRVMVILMNGIELEAHNFQHACARMNAPLQLALAQVRRKEQHQATMINWLLGRARFLTYPTGRPRGRPLREAAVRLPLRRTDTKVQNRQDRS